jgi:hypothetical protein
VGDAKVMKVIPASEISWQDMLDGRALTGPRVEAQRPAADQALADPITVLALKRAIGGGDLIQQMNDRHGVDLTPRIEHKH